jgi:GT2 family glycosyltransferase
MAALDQTDSSAVAKRVAVVTPRVTAVVLTWNNRQLIEGCLDSLRQVDWPNLEIVIVDNGSRDGTRAYVHAQKDVKSLFLARNRGFAGGQVSARPLITGDYVALVNSDAVISQNWLKVLMREMADSRVAAAGGRTFAWKGSESPGRTDVPYYSYQVVDKRTGALLTNTIGEQTADVDSISGAAVLVRVSSMDAVGGFDAKFFAYYEEADLFARMIRAGHKVRYVPSAHAWHMVRGSSRKQPELYDFYMLRNRALFFLRNFDARERAVAWTNYVRNARERLRRGGKPALVSLRALSSLALLSSHIFRSRATIARLGDSYCERLPGCLGPFVMASE